MGNPKGNPQYLKPVQNLPREQFLALASKGGKACTQVKKDAAKLCRIRERWQAGKFNEDDIAFAQSRVASRTNMCADLMAIANDVLLTPNEDGSKLTRQEKASLGHFYKEMLKTIHGDRVQIESTNINLNLTREMSSEELEEFKQFLGRRSTT